MPCSRKLYKRCKRTSRSSAIANFSPPTKFVTYCNIVLRLWIDIEKTDLWLQVWATDRFAATSGFWEVYSMERTVYSFTPPGVEAKTRSPILWPSNAFPTGDSLEIIPALGLAS